MKGDKLLSVAYLLMNAASERPGLEFLTKEDVKNVAEQKNNVLLSDEEATLILTTCKNMLTMQANGDIPDENDWFHFFEKPLTDKV